MLSYFIFKTLGIHLFLHLRSKGHKKDLLFHIASLSPQKTNIFIYLLDALTMIDLWKCVYQIDSLFEFFRKWTKSIRKNQFSYLKVDCVFISCVCFAKFLFLYVLIIILISYKVVHIKCLIFLYRIIPLNVSILAHKNKSEMEVLPQSLAEKRNFTFPMRVRGNHSSSFKTLQITTNHYEVTLRPFDKIVVFKIKFTPQIAADNRKQRTQLMNRIFPQLKTMIKNPVVSGFNVYSHEEGQQKERDFQCGSFTISIKQVKIFDIRENPKVFLTFLNNALRSSMAKNQYVEIGKTGKFFNSKQKRNIDNLMIFSGYKANFVYLEYGYFLRVDSAKKVVRNQTVLDYINTIYQMHSSKDKQERRNILKADLINKIVMTNYGTMRYHKIIDIHFKKGEDVMVYDNVSMPMYFLERYKIKINNANQPLLQVQSKKNQNNQNPTLIFPELCLMTGIPDNFDQMRRKKISQSTILNPRQKMKEIQMMMDELKGMDQFKNIKQLGIDLKQKMYNFFSKIIPTPKLALGEKNFVDKGRQAFFNLFSKPIYASKHSVQCGVVFFRGTDVSPLLGVFRSTSKNLGVKLQESTYEVSGRQIKDLINDVRVASKKMNIVLIVLPGNMKNQYKKIKKIAITNIQIVTQVVTDITLRKKGLQSIATKILLQIIAKRGNTLWVPQTTYKFNNTMLLGFDTAKSASGSTVISGSSTINSTFSSLFTTHKSYEGGENKFASMIGLATACMDAYVARNTSTPKELIILFNSCTGDQVSLYHELFFNPLVTRFRQAYNNDSIKITGVMVNTKNSQRFFYDDGDIHNVGAGTLISQGLVSKDYDFFLVSQQSNRGSTVPNHYRVIFSNSQLEEGALQELMFSQCFNYVNWTGSIKVPAILQYAKKACKFIADVMEDEQVPSSLASKPYFV